MVATVDHFLRLFCMSVALRACKQRLLFWRRQGAVDDCSGRTRREASRAEDRHPHRRWEKRIPSAHGKGHHSVQGNLPETKKHECEIPSIIQ